MYFSLLTSYVKTSYMFLLHSFLFWYKYIQKQFFHKTSLLTFCLISFSSFQFTCCSSTKFSLFLSPVIFIFFSVSWIDNCTNSFRTSSLFFFSILLLPRLLTHSRHPVSQSFTLTIITTRVSVNSTKEPLTSFPCPQKHHVLESPRFRLFLLAIHPDFCPLPDQRIHTISVRSSCWSMWFLESWERAWSAIDACAICSIYSYCLWKALSSRREDSQ